MSRRSIFLQRSAELDVKMTPMIDVVFLLLVFFIWTASFQIVEHVLPGNMSLEQGEAAVSVLEPPPEADFDDVVIRILSLDGKAAWRLNDAPVADLDELGKRLAQIASVKTDAPVILHPDRASMLGDVIDAYDAARLAGFAQVQFAASGG